MPNIFLSWVFLGVIKILHLCRSLVMTTSVITGVHNLQQNLFVQAVGYRLNDF